MAYPVSLEAMILRAQQAANLEGAGDFITASEWISYANVSIASWYDLIRLTTWGGNYFRAPYTFSTTASTSLYPLPANFVSMLSVDVALSANQVMSALAYQEEARNRLKWFPGGWFVGTPIYYQIQGQNINFLSAPQSSFTITLNFVPTAPILSALPDTLDSINGWEEYIVLDMGIRALIKDGQGDMANQLSGRLAREERRIRMAAANRDMSQVEQCHVQEDFGGWDY